MSNQNISDLDIIDYNNIILNAMPSPVDYRDWLIASNQDEIPNELDLRNKLLPIRNQGHQGTCYAQSIACAKEWQEKKNIGFNEYFSPQFIYNQRFNKYDENKSNDYGMYGRDVMKLISTIGICPEKDYPYGTIEHKENIDDKIFDIALNYKIKSYARINSIESLKLSLFKNGPCLIGFPTYNLGIEMWKKEESDHLLGGHAMTIVGYTSDSFIIRNSWGKFWGDNGYCYYKFTDWGAHWEIWTVVDDLSTIDQSKSITNPQVDNTNPQDTITDDTVETQEQPTNPQVDNINPQDTIPDDTVETPEQPTNPEVDNTHPQDTIPNDTVEPSIDNQESTIKSELEVTKKDNSPNIKNKTTNPNNNKSTDDKINNPSKKVKNNSKNNLEPIDENDNNQSIKNLNPNNEKNNSLSDLIHLIFSCLRYLYNKIFK